MTEGIGVRRIGVPVAVSQSIAVSSDEPVNIRSPFGEKATLYTYPECPDADDVVPHSSGLRKVRWRRRGSKKSGGVRVIDYMYRGG